MSAKIIKLAKAGGPPRKLGKHGMELLRSINNEFAVEDAGGVEMLLLACEALDRAQSCAKQIAEYGELLKTKTGFRENPLLKTELANRAFITRTLSRLGLEFEPIKSVGRPAVGFGWDGNKD